MWQCTITLLGSSGEFNVTGLISFNCERAISGADDYYTEVDVAVIVSNIAQLLASNIKKGDNYYFKIKENFVSASTNGELNDSIYVPGSYVYDPVVDCVYHITAVNPSGPNTVSAVYTQVCKTNYVDLSSVTLPSSYSVGNLYTALNAVDSSENALYLVKFANDYCTVKKEWQGYFSKITI